MVILKKTIVNNRLATIDDCLQSVLKNCAQKSDKIKFELRRELRLIINNLLGICEDCIRMAALPQGAFAACKVREQMHKDEMMMSRYKSVGLKGEGKNINESKRFTDYSPDKYNGKMMNSIWGAYNRYSPHNIKGNEYESSQQLGFVQQPTAVASYAIAQNLAMALRSDNWGFK